MVAILNKMAAMLDFQVAHRAYLTSSPQRTFVPNCVLVSQFARLVPLSAPLVERKKEEDVVMRTRQRVDTEFKIGRLKLRWGIKLNEKR